MITDINQLDLNKKYTYADYLTWQFKERVELLKGYVRKMSPAPSESHQGISSFLHGSIWAYLQGKKCKVRHATYDVRLIIPTETPIPSKRRKKTISVSDKEIQTVVQPDILVICDLSKIDKKGCLGAPDLVVEILSRGNNRDDLIDKFAIYEAAGLQEYWIVHPYEQTILVYTPNKDGKFIGSRPYAPGDTISSNLLSGLSIQVEQVFE